MEPSNIASDFLKDFITVICLQKLLLVYFLFHGSSQETNHVFDGVSVRIYEPASRTGVLPGFIWFHGGGFVYGDLGKK